MKAFLGVDPGKHGGLALLSDSEVIVTPMIVAGKDIDLDAIAEWIDTHTMDMQEVVACIEKVGAMPGQGVTSMFSFGFNTGVVHGILATFQIPRYMVMPNKWKTSVLAGTKKDKDAAIEFCRRVFPTVSLLESTRSRRPHSGMADAICIAYYASLAYG